MVLATIKTSVKTLKNAIEKTTLKKQQIIFWQRQKM